MQLSELSGLLRNISNPSSEAPCAGMVVQLTQLGFMHFIMYYYYPLNISKYIPYLLLGRRLEHS